MSIEKRPLAMGMLMAPMMLWMLQGWLTDTGGAPASAALIFVLAHVALVLVALVGGLVALRLSPRARALLNRLHRPSASHVLSMIAGVAGVVHLVAHGGIV